MKLKLLFFLLLTCVFAQAQTYRTTTEKFSTYNNTTHKYSSPETKSNSYKFVIDTIGNKITRTNSMGTMTWTINSKKPTSYRNGVMSKSFQVTEKSTGRITGRMNLSVSEKEIKITYYPHMTVSGREMEMGRHEFIGNNNPNNVSTKYMTTHFEDINRTTPLEEHSVSISITDIAIFFSDLSGMDEFRIIPIEEKSDPVVGKGYTTTVYKCGVTDRPDEKYIVTVNIPENADKATIVQLIHTVYGKPVYTKNYMSDMIDIDN